jgi:hypothetical protein
LLPPALLLLTPEQSDLQLSEVVLGFLLYSFLLMLQRYSSAAPRFF